MILTLLIFSVLNVALAFIDAHQFIKSKTVSHFLNGAEYVAMCLVAWLIFHNPLFIGVLLFNRLLVFNITLSKFRGKDWDYITPEPKPNSIIDRIAKWVFGMNGKLMYGTYAVVFTLLLIFSYML